MAAEQAAAEAQQRLDALDGQIRQLARSAYTGDTFSELDVMLTSGSADEFMDQLGTLDAIAGHTNDLVTEIALVSEGAVTAKAAADEATAEAQAGGRLDLRAAGGARGARSRTTSGSTPR